MIRWTRIAAASAVALAILYARSGEPAPKTIGPGSCITGNCHVVPKQWWQADDHNFTQQKFFGDPRANQYLAALKIDPANYAAVNSRCMRCHGTVVTGKEAAPPEDGVSCERCHGPGSDYLKIHQEKGAQGYAFGLAQLKKTDVRATVCVGCHYMQDSTLVNVGHTLGWYLTATDYTSGIKQKISRHWKTPTATPADLDPQPFLDAIAAKGPAPAVRNPLALGGGGGGGQNITVYIEKKLSPLFFPSGPPALVDLPPFPTITDSTAAGDILSLLDSRLDYLYRTLRALPGAP